MDDRARVAMPVPFHGESVKRHLDDFDLEASLNEVRWAPECRLEVANFYTGG
jgi:hypothetical protein